MSCRNESGRCRHLYFLSDGVSTNLLGVTSDGDSLEDTLRRYRDRVAVVAEHITENMYFNDFS